MYEVIYYSMGGNTKKLAEAIAGELGVEPEDVMKKESPAKGSLIFLGSGCYNQKPAPEVTDFINWNDFNGRDVVIFGTASLCISGWLKVMEKELEAEGAKIIGRFSCRGESVFFNHCFNRSRPNTKDLEDAREFARKMKAT